MNEYVQQAKDFLASCNATMEIKYAGLETPSWDSKKHNTYDCTIKTPRGEMKLCFYDSTFNTEYTKMTFDEYCCRKYNMHENYMLPIEKIKAQKLWKEQIAKAIPTEYDILACLQKYDVGSMDDFFDEFGYEIKCTKDMTNFINTYNAVIQEYNDVRRCFTEEQIEKLAEIS